MKTVYPLQALMALAALGLLIGLPSLDRTRGTLSSMPHSTSCFTNSAQTENIDKPDADTSSARSVTGASVPSAISNAMPVEQTMLDTNMRQTLRQCA